MGVKNDLVKNLGLLYIEKLSPSQSNIDYNILAFENSVKITKSKN